MSLTDLDRKLLRERRDWRERQAEAWDRIVNARQNEPPSHFNAHPDSWESFCPGNVTQRHGWPEAKITNYLNGDEIHRWLCGSCGRWLIVLEAD